MGESTVQQGTPAATRSHLAACGSRRPRFVGTSFLGDLTYGLVLDGVAAMVPCRFEK